MIEVTPELLLQLPKTDLHCHLDGSLRLETVLDLADQQGVRLPADDADGLAASLRIGEVFENLDAYLYGFKTTLSVLQREDALYRAAYELAEDAAVENVRYLEVRYAPILHVEQGLAREAIVDAVVSGLAAATADLGIRAGVILCGIRNQSPAVSHEMAQLAVRYKHRGVIGFDLAGSEVDHPAKRHRDAFSHILKNNVNCTLHAGEAYGAESIAQAVHHCGAHRIGHGTRLREDPDLMAYVNDHRIPLEVCISSNVQTGSVPNLASHPLREYYDFGIRTTINTDNRLMSNTTVSRELMLAHRHLGMSLADIRELIIYGFKSAFVPFREKRTMVEQVTRELDAVLASPAVRRAR